MKVSEFEAKLATVADARLRQMLMVSRRDGPEIAVQMVLAECRRRGMDGLESEDSADALERNGSQDAMAPDAQGATGPADESMDAPPATAPDWLNEETKNGMPAAVKMLLVVLVLGGLAGAAWMFSR